MTVTPVYIILEASYNKHINVNNIANEFRLGQLVDKYLTFLVFSRDAVAGGGGGGGGGDGGGGILALVVFGQQLRSR